MLFCIRLALCKAVAAKILPAVERIAVCLYRDANVALAVQYSYKYVALLIAVEDKLHINSH